MKAHPSLGKAIAVAEKRAMERTCNVFKALVSDGMDEHLHCSQSKLEDACRPGTLFTGRSRVEV